MIGYAFFRRHVAVLGMALTLASISVADDSDFPQFRGTGGRANVDSRAIPAEWTDDSNILWKVENVGSGWAQPVVVGKRVFVSSAVGEKPLVPKNFTDGVRTPQSMGVTFLSGPPKFDITWGVACYDLETGQELWQTKVITQRPKYAVHPSNSFATETPVADAEHVYVYFGATGRVAAMTHAGEIVWTRDLLVQSTSNSFGTGSSPAYLEGKLFIQNFGQEKAEVLCLDAATGQTLWSRERDEAETSWSSPIVWKNQTRVELVVSGGDEVTSYDPETGRILWTVGNVKAATACSLAMDDQQIYFGGSDPFSTGPLFAVAAGANGDLTPAKKNTEFEYCTWLTKRAAPGMASPVATGNLIYVPDKNILRSYRVDSGELVYQQRLPDIKMVNASPIAFGDKLLLVGESGRSCLVQTGETFQIVGGGQLTDTIWATPAVADNKILIRGLETLYCIGLPPASAGSK